MKNKRELRASIKLQLAYHEDKFIVHKRFPSQIEIEDFHFSPHKMLDEQKRVLSNEILVLMYNRIEGIPFEKVYGGNYNFNVENPPGIDIELHIKKPDKDLRTDLGEIARKLCIKHLKPAFVLPSRYFISCKIDRCELPDEKVQLFYTDLLNELQTKVQTYSIIKKEKQIKYVTPIKEINGEKQDWMDYENISENQPINKNAIVLKCSFCSYITDNSTKCKYCGEVFCRDHIKPKTPNEFYSTPGGHSCKPFIKQQEQNQSNGKVLNSKHQPPQKKSFWKRLRGK